VVESSLVIGRFNPVVEAELPSAQKKDAGAKKVAAFDFVRIIQGCTSLAEIPRIPQSSNQYQTADLPKMRMTGAGGTALFQEN